MAEGRVDVDALAAKSQGKKLSGQERARRHKENLERQEKWEDPSTWPDRQHFTDNGGMYQVVDVLFDRANRTLQDVLRIEKRVPGRNGREDQTVIIYRKVNSEDDELRAELLPDVAHGSVSVSAAESVATPAKKTVVKRPGAKNDE